ncbi:MAG: leucine-rich repeat domain-containing protein [Oscillospiraceae bacterium]|nr:leucine-rich repeat domain-containing protein [Oscillospiraceae bacterium]
MNKQSIFSILAVLTLCLTGCGNANNTTNTVSTKPTETATTETTKPNEKPEKKESEEKTEETTVTETEAETETETEATTLTLAEMIVTPSDEEFEIEYDKQLKINIITKYNGDAVSVRFPTEINGEKIDAIELRSNSVLRYVEIPEGIDNFSFNKCENLEEAVLPENLTDIPEKAFYDCKSLSSINIPDSIEIINEQAFAGCKNLTTFYFPKNLKEIKNQAFGCSGLQELNIPDQEIIVGWGAFRCCNSLEEIELPYNFNIDHTGANIFTECKNLKKATIHGSLSADAEIDRSCGQYPFPGGHTFESCESLEEVVLISDNDEEFIIGCCDFHCCDSLSVVNISNCNLTKIGSGAFSGCDSLKSLDLPDTVTVMDYDAFMFCDNLTVTYKGNTYDKSNINELWIL